MTPTYLGYAENITKYVHKKYDVVYSSHLLEDYGEGQQLKVLKGWSELLRDDNSCIILCLPDQKRYEKTTRYPNPSHKVPNFGLDYLRSKITNHFVEVCSHEFWKDEKHIATSRHGSMDFNFLIALKLKIDPVFKFYL